MPQNMEVASNACTKILIVIINNNDNNKCMGLFCLYMYVPTT